MIFNILSISHFSNAKLSRHPTNLPQFPRTLMKPTQSHQMNNNHAIGRIFQQYSFALSNGIKPVSLPPSNNRIHTRLGTGHGRLMQMRETLDRAKYELTTERRLREQQKNNARAAKKRSGQVRHMEMEEHVKQLEELGAKMEHWRDVSDMHGHTIIKISENVLKLKDSAIRSVRNVEKVTAEREEARHLLERERMLAGWSENRRHVAMSSLRQRMEEGNRNLLDEVKELQEAIRNKDHEIDELNEFCEGSIQQMEDKNSQIALHESSEEMDSFSHAVSCTLSEMREVMVLRHQDRRTLAEKMRDLHDAITDLVSEVKKGREPLHKTS